MASAVVAAGCSGPNDLKVINRTQVPVLVAVWDSRVAVGACSERTVGIAGTVLSLDNGGHPLNDPAPSGATSVEIPAGDIARGSSEGGMPTQVLVITDDYIGVPPWNGYRERHVAGSGTLPPDPGSVECAGSPPPRSSATPSPAPSPAPL